MTEISNDAFAEGGQWLERRGFNLRAVLDVRAFPGDLAAAWDRTRIPRIPGERLVLLGMGGSALWDWMGEQDLSDPDPFDAVSRQAVAEVAERFWEDTRPRLLYPGDALIPLQQLGRWAGWSAPAPLGLDISPLFGPWFAFRAAFLTTAVLPLTELATTASPCDTCHDQPCVPACAAGAVRQDAPMNRGLCTDQRLSDPGGCGVQCHSRLACPVGTQWCYPPEQLRYHGGRSLQSLIAWEGASER
ncbi:MAG: hypothetical protein QGF79_04950 [Arenicellales bacterium]|jgi:hypothetical protein|nr:hypothetical protein [Arenicellales bacterium]MDP6552726.1 hypothetical protein [Arenicellales bacterium]|tara:strand:- start:22625 stop:23359 length:735 start_codon:yes stop_codon:yes gene_type:complete